MQVSVRMLRNRRYREGKTRRNGLVSHSIFVFKAGGLAGVVTATAGRGLLGSNSAFLLFKDASTGNIQARGN